MYFSDNVPHMPWDIVLFFVCKNLNIRTLILRRTGISGYIYIDEDFRISKTNYKFEYKSIKSFNKKHNNISIDLLNDLSFTKNQRGGSWVKAMISQIFFINFFVNYENWI